MHFCWMEFLQQFHLVIRYKKSIYNKVADMLSRPIVNVAILLKSYSALPESYVEEYTYDAKCEEMEALIDGKRNHYSHQPSTFAIFAISNKIAAINALSLDGILKTIPPGSQV